MNRPKPILKKKVVIVPTVHTPEVEIYRDDAGNGSYYIYTANHWDIVTLFLKYHSISCEGVQIQGKFYQHPILSVKDEINFGGTLSSWLKTKGINSSITLSSILE